MTAAVHTAIEAGVRTIVLDHPPLNVMTDSVRDDLLQALAACRAAAVRAVILTGRGDHAFEKRPPRFVEA